MLTRTANDEGCPLCAEQPAEVGGASLDLQRATDALKNTSEQLAAIDLNRFTVAGLERDADLIRKAQCLIHNFFQGG